MTTEPLLAPPFTTEQQLEAHDQQEDASVMHRLADELDGEPRARARARACMMEQQADLVVPVEWRR